MSYQVLARKWRPKKFEDVVGQSHITRSLQNAITRNKLGHAYLLAGTRGVGKTSVARIFSKALSCESPDDAGNPCSKCSSCSDIDASQSIAVQEMDGASHNSVMDVRDLVQSVSITPGMGKYKIYIIDEVHMLSTAAFNALLKTLEEPPEFVIFILATTEAHKLPGTVLSRCQRFDFRHVSLRDLELHVKHIAGVEGITFEDDRLITQICEQGKGSVRDTLSLFDQVLSFCSDGYIDEETLVVSFGLAKSSVIKDMVEGLIRGESSSVSTSYRSLIGENVEARNITISLLDYVYTIISKIDDKEYLQKNSVIDLELVKELSMAELFWIYETLSQDFKWALESLTPIKTVEIVLQKICLRHDVFSKKKIVIETQQIDKKKSEITDESLENIEIPADEAIVQEPVQKDAEENFNEHNHKPEEESVVEKIEVLEVVSEEVPTVIKASSELKTWESFLTYLREIAPASASNLEQGNTLGEMSYDKEHLFLELGYKQSGKIFYEYLCTAEVKNKILDHLKNYFEVSLEGITLTFTMLEKEQVHDFRSQAEQKDLIRQKALEARREQISSDKLILEAEKIFDSKIEKIILNDKF